MGARAPSFGRGPVVELLLTILGVWMVFSVVCAASWAVVTEVTRRRRWRAERARIRGWVRRG